MNQSICDAIASKAILSIFYDGGTRVIEPHCYGVSTAGNEVLRCYQISGHSNSGKNSGWKLLRTDQISAMANTGDIFIEPRPHYNPNDKHMTRIYCSL